MSARAPLDEADARDFVARFADAWRHPDLDKHEDLWADDIELIQPLMGTLQGRGACREAFVRLFGLIPDLHAVVHRWSADGEALFIEFTLMGTFGGTTVAWSAVDRFLLVDGRVAQRVSYFDSAPLLLSLAARPRGWKRLVRSRFVPRFQRHQVRDR